MAVATEDVTTPRRGRQPRDPNAPRRTYTRQPGINLPLDDDKRKAIRDLAKLSGVKPSAFLADIVGPYLDQQITERQSNRERIVAEAKARSAREAAQRAAELAAQAEAELAALTNGS